MEYRRQTIRRIVNGTMVFVVHTTVSQIQDATGETFRKMREGIWGGSHFSPDEFEYIAGKVQFQGNIYTVGTVRRRGNREAPDVWYIVD